MPEVSNPFVNMQPGRKMDLNEIVAALREDLIAELDAVSLYQSHIDATDDERIKKVVGHIRDEEKQHVAEFMELIKQLDPTQAGMFMADHPTEIRERLEPALSESETPERAEVEGPESVGSLFGIAQES